MESAGRLRVAIVLAIICSLHRTAQVSGLRCYSCSGEAYCQWTINIHPQRVGRCHVNDGKCFVRRDPNGEVYLGCIDDSFWPGVPWRSYGHCAEDWERGWIYDGVRRPIVWCLCDDHDDCNVNIGDASSRPMFTMTPTTPVNRTTQQTQEPVTTTQLSRLTTKLIPPNVTCPADFRRVVGERSCYKVVSPTLADVSESRDYEQATRVCQSFGAHLVSIESIEEQRHLAAVLSTQPEILQGWQGWWTSGQLLRGTSLFVWRSSNRLVPVDRHLWGFVQSPIHDTCLWIMSISYFNYTLGNYDCSTRAGYVCEMELR